MTVCPLFLSQIEELKTAAQRGNLDLIEGLNYWTCVLINLVPECPKLKICGQLSRDVSVGFVFYIFMEDGEFKALLSSFWWKGQKSYVDAHALPNAQDINQNRNFTIDREHLPARFGYSSFLIFSAFRTGRSNLVTLICRAMEKVDQLANLHSDTLRDLRLLSRHGMERSNGIPMEIFRLWKKMTYAKVFNLDFSEMDWVSLA